MAVRDDVSGYVVGRPDHAFAGADDKRDVATRGLQRRHVGLRDLAAGELDPSQVVWPAGEQLPAGGRAQKPVTDRGDPHRRQRRLLSRQASLVTGTADGNGHYGSQPGGLARTRRPAAAGQAAGANCTTSSWLSWPAHRRLGGTVSSLPRPRPGRQRPVPEGSSAACAEGLRRRPGQRTSPAIRRGSVSPHRTARRPAAGHRSADPGPDPHPRDPD